MHVLLALCCLLQQDDPDKVDRKIERKQETLDDLDRRIKRALDDKRYDDADRLNREYREAQQELDDLKHDRDGLPRPARRRVEWIDEINFQATALWTHFDSSLGLDNDFGWSVGVEIHRYLGFEYRQWETQDNEFGGDAIMAQYLLSLSSSFTLDALGGSACRLGVGFGFFHVSTQRAGGDSDTGLMLAFQPEWCYAAGSMLRLKVGFDVDLLRTHYNSPTTGTKVNAGIHAGVELAF